MMRGTQFQEGSSALNIAEDRPYNIEIDQNSLLSPPSTGAGRTTGVGQRIMDRVKDTFGFERDPSQSIIDDAIDYAKQAPGKMMSSYGTRRRRCQGRRSAAAAGAPAPPRCELAPRGWVPLGLGNVPLNLLQFTKLVSICLNR